MWHIGDIDIGGRAVLGPMSGFTSRGYRDFMRPFGVSLCFTEMVSDQGILHGQWRTRDYLRFTGNHPTAMQIFGHDPGDVAEAAARALEMNPEIDIIDVNMGCPVPKVNRSGSGCALMRDPGNCGEIVRAIRRRTDVPVTAKIRLGHSLSDANFRKVIEEMESAGADAVTVHARAGDERYAGIPHYDMIENLRSEMSVPLIVSGNIYSLDDAIRTQRMTGAEGVMLARGAVGDPFLVTQVDRYFRTGERLPNPTVSQQVEWCLRLMDMLADDKGEEYMMKKMHCFAPRFISGCTGSRDLRGRLASASGDRAALTALLLEISDEKGDETVYPNGRSGLSDFEF